MTVGPGRCPRCHRQRIEGAATCAECGWHFEPRTMAEYGTRPMPSPAEPVVVSIHPDPFARRQVARWALAAFEVGFAVAVGSGLGSLAGGLAAALVAAAIGNDLLGNVVPVIAWWSLGGLLGGYGTLRFLAS